MTTLFEGLVWNQPNLFLLFSGRKGFYLSGTTKSYIFFPADKALHRRLDRFENPGWSWQGEVHKRVRGSSWYLNKRHAEIYSTLLGGRWIIHTTAGNEIISLLVVIYLEFHQGTGWIHRGQNSSIHFILMSSALHFHVIRKGIEQSDDFFCSSHGIIHCCTILWRNSFYD